ncbi:MAG: Gfo/Idh/MocA family oxidoreductase [Actinomycetota bacterium]
MPASTDRIGVAIVGYGLAGSVFHAPLIAASRDLELVSVVTANPERTAQAKTAHPGVRIHPSVEELWSDAEAHDLVVVAAPNRAHAPVALGALDAGLHVVVDKPFAPNSAEGRRIASAAADRGLILTVFQNRRLDGDFLTLRRLIGEGALGQPFRFESRYERWRPELRGDVWRERADPEEAGGVLFDLGSHLVDQANLLFGPPTHVYAEVGRRRPGAEVDDDVFLALTHPADVRSHLWASLVSGSLGPRFRVLGTAGAFEKHGIDGQEDQLAVGIGPGHPEYGREPKERWGLLVAGEEATPVETERGAYPRFYEGVVDAIRKGAPPPVDPADAVLTIEVLEAARESGRSGKVVKLPAAS